MKRRKAMLSKWQKNKQESTIILRKEWENATNDLVTSTPDGKIRFALINRWNIIKRTKRKLMFQKKLSWITRSLEKIGNEKPFLSLGALDLDFPAYSNTDHPIFKSSIGEKDMVLFYANNIVPSLDVGKDLITYWFETQIVPDFLNQIRERYKNYPSAKIIATEIYFYDVLKQILKHYGIKFPEENYKILIEELCDKHGLNLVKFSSVNDRPGSCDDFEISVL